MVAPSTANLSSPRDLFLGNRDILLLIFGLFPVHQSQISAEDIGVLDEREIYFESRKQLKNLASVCKSFCGPALDWLWCHLPSITPLLNIHPALQKINNVHYFGKPKPDEMERFEEYAVRVRSVGLTNATIPAISLTGYASLGRKRGEGRPLLPSLRSIHVGGAEGASADLAMLSILLSQLVTDLSFEGTFVSDEAFSTYTMPLIFSESPMVRRLCIRDDTMSSRPDIWSVILDGIPNNLPITSLDLRFPQNLTLSSCFFGRFSKKFPRLTSLTPDLHTQAHEKSEDLGIEGAFPALKTVHLINRSNGKICGCYPPSLLKTATSVTFHVATNLVANNAFEDAVKALAPAPSLREVYILGDIYLSPDSVPPFVKQLSQLEVLRVDVLGFEMPNSRGDEISGILGFTFAPGAAGNLRYLSVPLLRKPPHPEDYLAPTYAAISCLIDVALRVPKLRDIVLSIDSACPCFWSFETLQSLIQAWSYPEVPSDLRRLTIVDKRAPRKLFTPVECRDIARLLDMIFPRLDRIVMHPKGSREWDGSWEVIEEYRKMLQSLRLLRPLGMS